MPMAAAIPTRTTTTMTITTTDREASTAPFTLDASTQSLLLAWFSPACPIGAFSYSHGLETLVEDGSVCDRQSAFEAIEAALVCGSGWSDAVLLNCGLDAAARGDGDAFLELVALGRAMAPGRERQEETVNQGRAFLALCADVWPGARFVNDADDVALPLAIAAVGAAREVPAAALTHAYLSAFAANLVSAAVRLVPLGQTDGQRLTRDLAPVVASVSRAAAAAGIDDVGGFVLGLDAAAMRHETQYVRLFRS